MMTRDTTSVEVKALEQVAQRLRARYGLPQAQIDAAIADALAGFAGRPVRDFVPILVERQVRQRFETPPTPGSGGPV